MIKNCTHDKMPYVFNLGLITPLDTSWPNGFSLIFKFINIHEYAMTSFSFRTTEWKNLWNWITDDIKTGNNGVLMMFLAWHPFIYVFYDFTSFLRFSLIYINM